MFLSRLEYERMIEKEKEQDQRLDHFGRMIEHLMNNDVALREEINELKKQNETTYFG